MAETTYSNLIVQALENQQAAVDALAAARTAIAEAITAKGVSTPSTTKLNAMAAKINSIFQGRYAESGTWTQTANYNTTITLPISFVPSTMMMYSDVASGYDSLIVWWQDSTEGGRYYYYSYSLPSNNKYVESTFITPTISGNTAKFYTSSIGATFYMDTYNWIAIK